VGDKLVAHIFMKRYSSNKDINLIVRKLVKRDWKFKFGKKHGRIKSPIGLTFTVPNSPSDRRAVMNFKRDITRIDHGVVNYGQY